MTTEPIWIFGTSVEAESWTPGHGWPSVLAGLLGPGKVRNLGVGGQAMAYGDPASGLQRMDDWIRQSVTAAGAAKPRWVIIGALLNDLPRSDDVSPTRWATFTVTEWLKAQGITALVMTCTPVTAEFFGAQPGVINRRRSELNSWIRAQYWNGQLVDTGDLLATASGYADDRAMLDSLHPDASPEDGVDGSQVLALAVRDFLEEKGILAQI
jgi:hypothetical protein